MTNFMINFTNPWLLLVLIPAIGVALIPYFRLHKKYRRTRNRVTSLVLHIIIMVLTTLVLAGLNFTYDVPKEGNEIILLVDVSESQERSEFSETDSELSSDVRDSVVRNILYMCEENSMSVGVVTFGFDQNYCVPFTTNAQEAYNAYLSAALPDQSATDIASALNFARQLFNNPDTAKIVLISDGKETDGNAKDAIRTVLKQNTKVDFIDVTTYYKDSDLQLVDVVYPDYHVKLNEDCIITAVLQGNNVEEGECTISLRDNDVDVDTVNATVYSGVIEVRFTHKFTTAGLHEMTFSMNTAGEEDNIVLNNTYTSYYDLQNFNKVLILEGVADQSAYLKELLEYEDLYQATVMNLYTADNLPSSVDDLRQYDQIIMNNVANKDLQILSNPNVCEDFDKMLYEYVSVYGGGLFTVGGNEAGSPTGDDAVAHAYSKADMNNTLYQQMLPVQAINYTPPLGVVIIIDVSGSMSASAEDGYNRLHWAKEGANLCLNALSERDYIGIMTLFSSGEVNNEVILPMTPRTQESTIREAIYSIADSDYTGGTIYSGAIERAGKMLRALTQAEKKHVIIITDGQPGENAELYENWVREFYEMDKITFSVVGIGVSEGSSGASQVMESIADICAEEGKERVGRTYYLDNSNTSLIGDRLKDDLNADDLKEVNYETYYPAVKNIFSTLVSGLERLETNANRLNVTLEGYYGVKARSNADLILAGNYEVPLYAQWKFGNGMVGSFMCDLNKVWSAEFMENETGQTFIRNVVDNLMPVNSIRPIELNIKFTEDNYTNTINVFDVLNEGERIEGYVTQIVDTEDVDSSANERLSLSEKVDENLSVSQLAELGFYVRNNLNKDNNYSGCEFIIKQSGVYMITLNKVDADGNVLATHSFYKSFAYSEEYDLLLDDAEIDPMVDFAQTTGGNLIEDIDYPVNIFKDFTLTLNFKYDPRYLFIILAIVLFLLDIIVRKFKFKWPHEWFRKKDDKFKK